MGKDNYYEELLSGMYFGMKDKLIEAEWCIYVLE